MKFRYDKISLPLFWKFTIAIIAIVAIFGSVNVFFIRDSIYKTLRSELEKRGLVIARSVAEKSITWILYDDIASLYKLVNEVNNIDSSVAYVFILNGKNEVIAHTFETGIPQSLIDANKINRNKSENTILIKKKHEKNTLIRDIAVPILDGKAGVVRIGLNEKHIYAAINDAINTLLIMVVVFLFAGIFGAFVFSYIITKPIKVISNITENIDINSLKNTAQNRINIKGIFPNKLEKLFHIKDETDILVAKFNDMLERLEKTYSELQLIQSSLLQSEKLTSIGTLAAGIAHEMNNPIAGLQNCIRRISKNPDNIQQNKKYLVMMADATKNIEKVVHGLLDFSRKRDFKFQKVDIKLVIENALILAAYKLEKSRISIKKTFPDSMPCVKGSRNHLEQVVLNLILNSIDAINERHKTEPTVYGRIIFSVFAHDSKLCLLVTDNGIGIQQDKINKIFDPFFTSKKEGKGTGLGLSICYNIIKEHNGDIKAEGLFQKGVKFTISLPIYN